MVQDKASAPLWPALVAVNIAALIFGTTALFGRVDASPVWIVAGRGFFACVTLGVVAAGRGLPLRLARERLGRVVLSGLLLALHWIAFFTAVRVAGVAIGTLTAGTFPLFTIVLDAMRRGRSPSVTEWIGGITIVVAVGLISG